MRPTDLEHLAVPSDPQLHPDGKTIVYVLTEVDLDDDRELRTIHRVDAAGTRRFTHGPADTSPRWSPDGRWLALLRKGTEEGAKPQLHVMPADGGEAQRRTDLPLGVTDLAWAPDSQRLVVVGAVWQEEVADLSDEERRRRPRRITRLPYRTDSQGWIHDRQVGLWIVEVAGDGEPQRLDTGPREVAAPQWCADGRAILYVGEPDDGRETEPHTQVFALDLDTGTRRAVVAPGGWIAVHEAADGALLLTGLCDPMDWPGTHVVWWCPPPAANETDAAALPARDAGLVALSAHLDRDAVPMSPSCVTVGPRLVDDGFLLAVEGRGTIGVVRVVLDGFDPHGDTPPPVVEVVTGPRAVTGFSASPDGAVLAMTVTDPATPGELIRVEDGHERCLTDLARGFRAAVDLRPTIRFTFTRDDVDLDVWAVLPAGFDDAPPRSVPVLFNIHGGPTAQYGEYFFDEFQVEAGAGYLVVGTNPRGSSGRGAAWARAVVGAWMHEDSVDTLDLEAVVDATLARFPQADPERVGIMGGSYGGYATARLLARTSRYRSAIVERGLLQWESFCGTSDIGPYFDRMFLGTSLVDGAAAHHAASPVRTARRITTPTLVLHSDADWRCPPEQGEQLFVALKHAGVPTEMLRFPDESHELSRSGSPRHRVERFEAVLDWHGRYLDPPARPAEG